jgi:hypothetical protein
MTGDVIFFISQMKIQIMATDFPKMYIEFEDTLAGCNFTIYLPPCPPKGGLKIG